MGIARRLPAPRLCRRAARAVPEQVQADANPAVVRVHRPRRRLRRPILRGDPAARVDARRRLLLFVHACLR